MAYGMKSHMGVSLQNSWGTSMATSKDYVQFASETLAEDIPSNVMEGMKGRYEEPGSYEGTHAIAGDILMEVHPVVMGKFILGWCGQSSAPALASSVYAHSMIPVTAEFDPQASLRPLTIEMNRDAGSAYQYYDMLVDQITFEYAHGALLKSTVNLLGGKFEKLAKTTAAYLPGSNFPWNTTSVSFGGAAIDEISQMTITCANQLEAIGTLDGTKTPNRIKRSGYRTVEISGTILFVDNTEADKFLAMSDQRVIVFSKGETIGNAANSLKIDVPNFQYTAFPINVGGAGKIEVGFTGKAKFNETSNYLIEFVMSNTRAAYV